eukprot:TRINITY_DN2473_c0_g1_i1.p1 TRINITY_DN2473_c0_g1~~TRINITY_DN2473_c0_g1_i1.p1  ORF type:complete len:79 (-),score=20.19 TRINITY_DN2473_c0_g1_i1:320-535(-)
MYEPQFKDNNTAIKKDYRFGDNNEYVVVQILGSGNFGTTYQVTRNGKDFALKEVLCGGTKEKIKYLKKHQC